MDPDPDDPGTGTGTLTRTRTGARTRPAPRLRRLQERAPHTAPAPIAWIVGTGLGAAAGGVFHLWEALVLAAMGVPIPTGDARTGALATSAVLGAVLGAWAAAPSLYGPRWATTAVVTLAGWLLAAPIGTFAASLGIPAVLGVAVGLGAAVVAGQLAGRVPAPAPAHQGFAAGLYLALALAVPLHVSVLPGPGTPGAVLATALAVAFAAVLAAGAAAVARPDRAPWLPLGAAAILALGLHGIVRLRAPPPPSTVGGPAVVVVVVSGLRADRLGALGADRARTPHLDRFARTAVVYTQAHATSNWTVPSLASALTGRLPRAHGAGENDGFRNTLAPLRPDIRTVAQTARRAGVWTAAAVGDPGLRTWALDAGFARWRDDPGAGARPVALLPLGVAGLDPTGWPVRVPAERVVDEAIAALDERPPGAMLLLVQLDDAAGPFSPTPADEAAVGRGGRSAAADRYDAALRRVDRALGRLLDAVPADAWVVVLGDRGVLLNDPHARVRFGRGMSQELLHVPLLVRAPGVAPRRVDEPVSVVDVAPTLLAALGLPAPEDLDGAKLGAPFGEAQPPRTLVAQAARFGAEQQMVRVGRYKLVQADPRRVTVYDLAKDPAEASPLGTESRENDVRERKLQALLPPRGAGTGPYARPGAAAEIGRLVGRLWNGRLR